MGTILIVVAACQMVGDRGGVGGWLACQREKQRQDLAKVLLNDVSVCTLNTMLRKRVSESASVGSDVSWSTWSGKQVLYSGMQDEGKSGSQKGQFCESAKQYG